MSWRAPPRGMTAAASSAVMAKRRHRFAGFCPSILENTSLIGEHDAHQLSLPPFGAAVDGGPGGDSQRLRAPLLQQVKRPVTPCSTARWRFRRVERSTRLAL